MTDDSARTHWQAWHLAYEDPHSALSRRLEVVQTELARALDDAPVGPIRLLSLCAGDGRDVLGALRSHRRGPDVVAVLVELDQGLASQARRTASSDRIGQIEVLEADAGRPLHFVEQGASFDVVLSCGIFGNISDADIKATVFGLSTLVNLHGQALWTRHRRAPDVTPMIRSWFQEAGFEELAFVEVEASLGAVGRVRLRARDDERRTPDRLFHFVGDGELAHS